MSHNLFLSISWLSLYPQGFTFGPGLVSLAVYVVTEYDWIWKFMRLVGLERYRHEIKVRITRASKGQAS